AAVDGPGRARAAAACRRRGGHDGGGADARGDVRPHGGRPGLRPNAPIAATGAATALTGVLHYATDQHVLTFVVAAVALAGLAWIVVLGTESVGSRFGPGVTGVLQSTLGNLPELFIVLFALSAGEIVVAQT